MESSTKKPNNMKLKSILYILMLLPFLWSCNNEDDVEEIFASGTWHVVDFYGKANWDKRNGEPKYNAMAHNPDKTIAAEGRKALNIIHGFNITFKADGTFTGSIQNGTIEGTWQADGKDRTVNINFTKTPSSTSYNNEFIEALNNAIFYQGDSNVLLLAPEGKKTYIQFAHNKQD
jgi:hypothetical protein